jgi:hypothetical protein
MGAMAEEPPVPTSSQKKRKNKTRRANHAGNKKTPLARGSEISY